MGGKSSKRVNQLKREKVNFNEWQLIEEKRAAELILQENKQKEKEK